MATMALPGTQPPGGQRDLVFISYSHHDRDWLGRLQVFLKPYIRQDLQVWADTHIRVGSDWRRDISTVLSRSCVGVLLLSPDFLASDFIYDEELPALLADADAGALTLVSVLISACDYKTSPLTRFQFALPSHRPLDSMPRPRRNAVLVQIAEKIAEAAQRAPPGATVAPTPAAGRLAPTPVAPIAASGRLAARHGVPGQRPNYLRRQEYLDRLKEVVLDATDRAIGITGATSQGARIGLHGMGGIGKTVLAIDLVDDEEVRRTFPDGIFWLTLGQATELLRLQGELAGYLSGETRGSATVNEARDHLRQLFDGKACLLVLDDLWRPQDAEPFDVLGPRSRLLLTTRDADLLVALGARELPLDVLSEELALELLASWSGEPRAALPAMARKVAASCGYLPLALALAGARVQGGARWQEVLSALERGRLEFLDHPYGSVFSSLRLGTDALAASDRDRYFDLAVFPEDADIPVATICTLWRHTGAMETDASWDLLRRLHRRALLIRSEDGGRVSFHDLQHDFLRLNIASLVEGHAALVGAYRGVAASSWASGLDDGYFFQHLPQHLFAADRLEEVKALLCTYDWLAAKLRATDITDLLTDYDLIASDRDLSLIEQALRLSIRALLRDRSQLPGQLLGRLRGVRGPAIEVLLAAERGTGRAWLRPRNTSLTPPGGPLRQILVGHTGGVHAVAVLPDGRRALSGSYDNTLRLWDLATGETLFTLEGHMKDVTAVAVTGDGSRALSGSADNTLRLWDLATGETLLTLEGHMKDVTAVAVTGDGSRALSSSYESTLRLWDLTTGETLRTLEGHTSAVPAVAVLADGSRALSGSHDNTLRLWDLATGATLCILEGHTDSVYAVAVLPDGSHALSGSRDNTLRLWDLATGATLRILEGHTDWIRAVTLLADGSRALSGSGDKTLRLWDLATGETLRTLEGHTRTVTAVAVTADGSALSGSEDNTLRLWDLATGETLNPLEGHTEYVRAVAVFADGSRALSGSGDSTVRLWDLATGKTLRTLRGHTHWVTAMVVLADGSRALSGSLDKTLRLWDLATGETLRTLVGHTSSVNAVAVLADGSRALSGSLDKTLRLWDLATGKTLRTLRGHTHWVTAMVVLADGSRALSGSLDKTLRLWDLATGETLRTLVGHTSSVNAVAVLADGSRALSGSTDNTLRLWDLATGETLRTLEGHTSGVARVAVLADGSRALSGSTDKTLRLWDLSTGETLRTLEGHTSGVYAVAVLADGTRALSGSEDHTLRLWDLATGRCLAEYTGDAAIRCVAVAPDDLIVAGSEDGRVHILDIRER